MKHKVLLISLALVLATTLAIGAIGCEGEVLDTIYVGLARDLDGPLAVFECGYGGTVYRYYADKVNEDGGIYLSSIDDTLPVELVVRDFDVMTWDIAAVTEALIETDGVHFIWGGPGTDCIFTQAPVCNAAGIVFMGLEGGASSMIWGGQIDVWPYVWPTLSFSNWYQIPVLHNMMVAATGGPNPTAYITYIGGMGQTHGLEYKQETINEFGGAYVTDGGFHDYQLDSTTAAAVITAAWTSWNATPYDIFCAWTYPWNVYALTTALLASGFHPDAVIFGPGANAEAYNWVYGAQVEDICSFVVAVNSTSAAISDMYADLAAQIEADWASALCAPGGKTSGWQDLDYWGHPCYVAGLQLWEQAVEAAGTVDSADVRAELATINATTCLGQTWFDVFGGGYGGGILSYNCHPGEVGQWQSGQYEIVGGINTTASFGFPGTWAW